MEEVAWIASGTALMIAGALIGGAMGWVLLGVGVLILVIVGAMAA